VKGPAHMSKRAIVVAPGIGRVLGMYGDPQVLRMWIDDRMANGEGFAGRLELRPQHTF